VRTVPGIAIWWLRRDLRIADNAALRYALDHAGTIVPVYIHALDEEDEWPPGAASRWWLHHSLSALAAQLEKRGSRLIVSRGPSLPALQKLIESTGATLVTWNRVYDPALLARDRKIETALAEQVAVHTTNSSLLFEPGSVLNGENKPYRVFTPFWRAVSPGLDNVGHPWRAPKVFPASARWPASLDLKKLGLLPKLDWADGFTKDWRPGEAGALRRLRDFRDDVATYETSRNRPDSSGTSRLSPHLHFGEIGPRQVVTELQAASGGSSAGKATDSYLHQIGWREFAHQLLFHFPATVTKPMDARFARMTWSRSRVSLRAWQRGLTGYPLVDAGMRQLWKTGWMHNRVRMIVASFLIKNLRHHWLDGAHWFWDTLVDADLANNTMGWQWTAGCGADAAPYYRIFNPMLQTERYDPQHRYIREWVPELARLPDRWIHEPWAASDAVLAAAGVTLGKSYPRPIVDFKKSRDAALAGYRRTREPAAK
jgi:deoxyribodipyrimidine photo-lyase